MPKARTKTTTRTRNRRRILDGPRGRQDNVRASRSRESRGSRRAIRGDTDHAYIVKDGCTTHVLVPADEYEELVKASMVQHAIGQIEKGDNDFVDADDIALELAAERIAKARRAAGLTQKQLGQKLKLPQSQISRIERNPDHTTVRTLKRIARALGVDLRALV